MIDFHRVGTLGVIESGAGKKKTYKNKSRKNIQIPTQEPNIIKDNY